MEQTAPIVPTGTFLGGHNARIHPDLLELPVNYQRMRAKRESSSPNSNDLGLRDEILQTAKEMNNKYPTAKLNSFQTYQSPTLKDDLIRIHHPDEIRLRNAIILLVASIICVALFLLEIYPEISILTSLACFSLSTYMFTTQFKLKPSNFLPVKEEEKKQEAPIVIEQFEFSDQRPSERFLIKSNAIIADYTETTEQTISTLSNMSLYRPFVLADRATSSFARTQYAASPDTSIDQLASETIQKLGLSSSTFNQYLVNMKSFIAKSLMNKLDRKLHSDEAMVEAMLTVPRYEHCRPYIIQRIHALASSPFLAGHFGPGGDRWHDNEWSDELPSDNQIVLHILGMWLSYFMRGRKSTQRVNVFQQKYVSINKEVKVENDDQIVLCSDDWTNFYVITKPNPNSAAERFWAFSGIDSMYAGFAIFFWFVMKKMNFLFDGADLKDTPFCMHRVYKLARLE